MSNKKNAVKKLCGDAGFNEYYGSLFAERWTALKAALSGDVRYAEWNAGKAAYFLDSGSVRAAATLPLKGAKRILDMCAAPGGKTLVLACLMDSDAELFANERSFDRYKRLCRVLDEHLPAEIRERVHVSCSDGATLCKREKSAFDRILLDAPCSSERHVLGDEKYLSEWSPSRIKMLSAAQWALFSSAFRLLRQGGFLVYSTCALTKSENDDILRRALKKFDDAEICDVHTSPFSTAQSELQKSIAPFCAAELPDSEATEFGQHILPDLQNGAGPLFFSLVRKK